MDFQIKLSTKQFYVYVNKKTILSYPCKKIKIKELALRKLFVVQASKIRDNIGIEIAFVESVKQIVLQTQILERLYKFLALGQTMSKTPNWLDYKLSRGEISDGSLRV